MDLLPSCGCVNSVVWIHHLDVNETPGEKARWKLHNNATCCLEEILEASPPPKKQQFYGYLSSKKDEQNMLSTTGEIKMNS